MSSRVALISGGAKGIGRGIALALAAQGWSITLCYRTSQEAAQAAALDQWRHCAVSSEQLADLASPAAFDLACASASEAEVLRVVRASPDIDRHIAWLHDDAELGFDRIYLHNVARDHQAAFLHASGEHLLPAFAVPHENDFGDKV